MSVAISDINRLVSPFKEGIIELLRRAKEAGIPEVRVTETYRTAVRQLELFNAGYSKIKTPTYHGVGHAADFYVKDYDQKLYNKLYELSKDIPYVIYPYYDLNWGWDGTHFQYDPNKKGDMNMTYDLFGDKPTGKVYERLNNYALVHLPDVDFAVRYYGTAWASKIQWVDDIWSVGWIAEDPRPIKDQLNKCVNQPPSIEIKEVIKYVDKITYKDSPATLEALEALKIELAELKKAPEKVCPYPVVVPEIKTPPVASGGLVERIKRFLRIK